MTWHISINGCQMFFTFEIPESMDIGNHTKTTKGKRLLPLTVPFLIKMVCGKNLDSETKLIKSTDCPTTFH